VVLLLDLSMVLRKSQVQLNPNKEGQMEDSNWENVLHDSSNFEFEKLLNFYKSFSDGEEEEGYALLNNTKDNYVGIEEELDN